MQQIYKAIIKHGLKQFSPKSRANDLQLAQVKKQEATHRQGGIFVVQDKSHFTTMQGRIVRSYEQLDRIQASHWTPNVYKQFRYTDEARTRISGFEERNLLQVNTFVIDIDTKAHSVNDILLACIDNSIGAPTLILESERGYQLYFVLETPMYISSIRNGLSLKVAKRISHNIKRSLQAIEADIFCNDFGFFRMPNKQNVVWQQLEQTYTPNQFISWSQRFDDGQPLYVSNKSNKAKHTQSTWFMELVNLKYVRGMKSQIGRNNLLFTVALACFADGLTQRDASDMLYQLNYNLHESLAEKEVETILASAYSGKYSGPAKEYVEALLSSYGVQMNVVMQTGWYKHKKARKDRVRSHIHEWEQDLEKYLESHEGPVELTQAAICKALKIPRASLNKLVGLSRKILKKVSGRGCQSVTLWATLTQVTKLVRQRIAATKQSYKVVLHQIAQEVTSTDLLKLIENLVHDNKNQLSTVP